MEKYTAFDLELASRHPSSICAIGVCAVENNRVVFTYYTKVKPAPFMMENGNYKIHHIQLRQLQDAPTFEEVWEKIGSYFNNTVIVAHNIQQDALALRATLDYYKIPYPTCNLTCTFILTKKLLEECPSYKLDGIADYFHLSFTHHHALEDAMMCFRIIKKLKNQYQVRELNDLHLLLHLDYGKMSENYYKNIFNSDVASNQCWKLDQNKDPNHFLYHQCVCLDSIHSSYLDVLKQYIEDKGGFIQEKVNINTDYLISAGKKKSKNYKKAQELVNKGQDIQMISMRAFMKKIKELQTVRENK